MHTVLNTGHLYSGQRRERLILGSFFDLDLTELGGVSQRENEKTSLQKEGSLYNGREDEMV